MRVGEGGEEGAGLRLGYKVNKLINEKFYLSREKKEMTPQAGACLSVEDVFSMPETLSSNSKNPKPLW